MIFDEYCNVWFGWYVINVYCIHLPMGVSIGVMGQKNTYVGIRGIHTGMDANPPFDHEKATFGPRTAATTPLRSCLLALIPSILFVNILLKGAVHFE